MSICKHPLRPHNRPLTIDNPSTRPCNGCLTSDNHLTRPCNRCLTSDNRPTRPCNGCSTSDNRPTRPCNGCLTSDNHLDPHRVKTRCSVWGLDTVWLEAQHATQLSRTTQSLAVKDVDLRGIFVVFKSGIVISFLLSVANIRFYPRRQKRLKHSLQNYRIRFKAVWRLLNAPSSTSAYIPLAKRHSVS